MKVLITGGAGFIGSHLADIFLEHGHSVAVIDKKEKNRYVSNKDIQFFECDITDKIKLEKVFSAYKPDVVDHHAALINVPQALRIPVTYAETNVLGSVNLLELSKKYSVSHFLFASSAAVYGKPNFFPVTEDSDIIPDSFYGLDKSIGEIYIRLYAKYYATTIFRYANIYGPRQNSEAEGGAIAIFAKAIAAGEKATIFGDGKQTRDFLFVKDVARANIMAVEKKKSGLMNLGTNREVTINETYATLLKVSGNTIKPEYKQKRPGDVARSVLDNRKAEEILGWKPTYSLEEGLRETYTWFAEQA